MCASMALLAHFSSAPKALIKAIYYYGLDGYGFEFPHGTAVALKQMDFYL